MIEVYPSLFVGAADSLYHAIPRVGDEDPATTVSTTPSDHWYVVTTAKDPWHRKALGYTTRGAPKDDPNYFYALAPNRFICNVIDSDDPAYVPERIIEGALEVISEMISPTRKVLVHCNQGQSRSPTIALLWLHRNSAQYQGKTYDEAADQFRQIYPPFAPSKGMEGYARQHW